MTVTVKRVTLENEVKADFTCMLSKIELKVAWYKDEKIILASGKHELVDEGRMHKLVVHDLCIEDYADYMVVIGSRRMTGHRLKEGWSFVCCIVTNITIFFWCSVASPSDYHGLIELACLSASTEGLSFCSLTPTVSRK